MLRAFFLVLCLSSTLFANDEIKLDAEARKVINLWPGTPPGNKADEKAEQAVRNNGVTRLSNVRVPTLAIYPVAKENAPSVIVCPGGGYHILAYDKEGEEIAKWLNSQGFNAFLLKYRLPVKGETRYVPALQDTQRALSTVRSLAEEYKLDAKKIGIMGFSAGGHLSAVTATAEKRTYDAIDKIDEQDFMPDFAILVYPAYLKQDEKLLNISDKTPPVYFMHAEDDKNYFENSPFFHDKLIKAGKDSTFAKYTSGGHGHGMRKSGKDADKWPDDLGKWLERFK